MPDRRAVLTGLTALPAALGLASPAATARTPFVLDGAGRRITIPASVRRIFPAGPPAAILIYTLAPDLLIGWPRANRPEEREFLLPEVGSRPEVGRITGRGNTANLELVLALQPDLIIDAGSVRRPFAELADRAQGQTGIPYALLDGRLDVAAGTYQTLGQLLDRRERAKVLADWCDDTMRTLLSRTGTVTPTRRPRVYYARGPRGLETGLSGSINVEAVEFLGAVNVASGAPGRGLAQVSLEQVLVWNPEIIVTIDQTFAATVRTDPAWAGVSAVADGRIHLSPKLPFGWVDFPPSVNRLIGLWWLGKVLYPTLFPEDMRSLTRDFYTLFYHLTPTDQQIDRVLAGRD
ncbi:iron ABC transporter substrate-binding protein [Phreatobacter sp.]|uniref:iron ABC transporter substrate-binding protein n=1 Tax=Phreatobacter sp. TaxID=1966341 RepID=UPI003F6FA43F